MKFPEVGKGNGNGNGLGSGVFLKLKDGDKVQGIFVGDPSIFRQHWIGGRSSQCMGKAECEHCKGGDKPKFRFRINFLTKVDGVWVAKVFENAYGMYLDLKEMHESSYDLPSTLVTLSRTGEKTDTRYRVLPVKDNGGLKSDQLKKLAGIPLNDLSGKSDTPAEAEGEQDANEDIPF